MKEEEAHWFLNKIVAAMNDYIKYGVVHRDIKLQNLALVFLGVDFESLEKRDEYFKTFDFKTNRHLLKVMVIDFGFACKLSDDGVINSLKVGSPLTRAPEVTRPG